MNIFNAYFLEIQHSHLFQYIFSFLTEISVWDVNFLVCVLVSRSLIRLVASHWSSTFLHPWPLIGLHLMLSPARTHNHFLLNYISLCIIWEYNCFIWVYHIDMFPSKHFYYYLKFSQPHLNSLNDPLAELDPYLCLMSSLLLHWLPPGGQTEWDKLKPQ